MLTARQTDRLQPLLSENNNKNFYRSRVPKCLFGVPEQSDEIFEKETIRYREAFKCKWDYNVMDDKPVENPRNYLWSENLCNENNKTKSSDNLVKSEERLKGEESSTGMSKGDVENCRIRRTDLKRYSDENCDVPSMKKKRQILLPGQLHKFFWGVFKCRVRNKRSNKCLFVRN